MYKIKKQKKTTITDTKNISGIIKKLELTDQDVAELNNYINDDININTEDSISKIFSDQNLARNKIILISYMRGILESLRPTDNIYMDQSDAFDKISDGFQGWNIEDMLHGIVPIFHTLIMSCFSDPDELSEYLKLMSDYFAETSEKIKNRDQEYMEIMNEMKKDHQD